MENHFVNEEKVFYFFIEAGIRLIFTKSYSFYNELIYLIFFFYKFVFLLQFYYIK